MTEFFPICFSTLFLSSCEQAAHQRHIQHILCEKEPLCSTRWRSGYNSQYGSVAPECVMSMRWIEYRWCCDKRSSSYVSNPGSILHPPSYSLPSPPCLLTCAVRGDINLSDRLCDPPPRLGGRSAVNINILPGVSGHGASIQPPWLSRITGRRTLSPLAWLQNATLTPSLRLPKKNMIDTVSLVSTTLRDIVLYMQSMHNRNYYVGVISKLLLMLLHVLKNDQ